MQLILGDNDFHMFDISSDELIKNPKKSGRHIVILGAGASIASFLDGDKNGKKAPCMNELPEIIGEPWEKLISISSPPEGDFEFQFSWIRENGNYVNELQKVENVIDSYFSSLELPDFPTIYDYLILGLRKKDLIASFNWDPFLMLSYHRNKDFIELPDIRFLHGNVSYTTCIDHDVLGLPNQICPQCEKPLIRSGLFYPDHNKDYSKDTIIYRDWERVTKVLENSIHLTIFGYSGPKTDFMARQLLLNSWRKSPSDRINYLEVIDIKSESEIDEIWDGFFPHNHSIYTESFWNSSIFEYPRRTAEWKYNASIEGKYTQKLEPPRTNNITDLHCWYSDLANYEKNVN